MPLAFPSNALYQDYRHDSVSNGGYYTNEDSEADTPFSPPVHAPQEIVIDPALLGESEVQQASSFLLFTTLAMLVSSTSVAETAQITPALDIPPPQPVHHFPEHLQQYRPTSYEPPPINHLQHPPYLVGGPFVDPNLPPPPLAPSEYFQQDPRHFHHLFNDPANTYGTPHPPMPELMPTSPAKPIKPGRKRRRPPREDHCSFCQGSDRHNKHGLEEPMVSCCKCGRSGHPSCIQIERIGEVIRNYDWMCMECKHCEICKKKGRENLLLFCDACDRGWHTYCLTPQLQEPPKGSWACPICAPPAAEGSSTIRRSSSIASSSRVVSERPVTNGKTTTKGKGRDIEPVPPTPVSVDEKAIEHPEPPPKPARGRPRKSAAPVKKGRNQNPTPEPRTPAPAPAPEPPSIPPSPSRSLSQRMKEPPDANHGHVVSRVRLKLPKGKGKGKARVSAANGGDDDEDDPFEGILSAVDADTSKTTITSEDKTRFENARTHAEAKLGPVNALPLPFAGGATPGPSQTPLASRVSMDPEANPTPIRPLRSLTLSHLHLHDSNFPPSKLGTPPDKGKGKCSPLQPTPTTNPANITPLRIRSIRFGEYEIDTWYDAPFPEEYASVPDGMLWICEFCLKCMKSRFSAGRHRLKCKARHPPGDEIYRDENVSVFEVDGRKNKIYCQNLCLLSKMFLDHKSLFYDVEPFLFYVVTEVDDVGARFIGYFSKEKRSPKDYNLSCIMTLPVRQKRGWGNFLIDLSYSLSKKEGRIGGPETPLSALGALTYRRYWTLSLMYYFRSGPRNVTLPGISAETSMTIEDIYTTLQANNMIITYENGPGRSTDNYGSRGALRNRNGRFVRSTPSSSVARRNVSRKTNANNGSDEAPSLNIPRRYRIKWDPDAAEKYVKDWEDKGQLRLKPERLKWSPFLLARSQAANDAIDGGIAETTALVDVMAQRAEEEAARLEAELAEMDQMEQDTKREIADETHEPDEGRVTRSSRASNGFIPTKTPRNPPSLTSRSMVRTRSARDLRDSISRASRSRAGSFSGEDENGDGLASRVSQRLRLRGPIRSSSRSLAMATLKRKRGQEVTSDEDEEMEVSPKKRLRRRTTSNAPSSAYDAGGDSDSENSEEDVEASEIVTPRPAPRPRRGPFGSLNTPRKSSTPADSPRKRQRIDSSPELESEPEQEAPSRRRRGTPTRSATLPQVANGSGSLKSRLRSRNSTVPGAPEGQSTRQTRRSVRGSRAMPNRSASTDSETSAEEDEDQGNSPPETPLSPQNGVVDQGSFRTKRLPRLDFESTGSLSSVDPEPLPMDIKEEEPPPMDTAVVAMSVDALTLLAEAAGSVAPSDGQDGTKESTATNGDHRAEGAMMQVDNDEELDAEGEVEDWE